MSPAPIPAVLATPGVRLVALADPHRSALDGRGGLFGVAPAHRYADLVAMLDNALRGVPDTEIIPDFECPSAAAK